MKKIIKILFVILVFLIIPNAYGLSKEYEDITYKIVGEKVEENKINLYLFHRNGCPHCAKEIEFLDTIQQKYKNIKIYKYEVTTSTTNASYYKAVKNILKDNTSGVPYTVIGNKSFVGYSEFIGEKIEKTIQDYLEDKVETEKEKTSFKIPILKEIDAKEVSIPLVAIVLGLVDGFNPCAMWVLLFLINMFFGMKNKKKMFILGYAFLLTSGLVYFLSMLGISVVLNIAAVGWIQKAIAVVALVVGILNIRTYIKTRDDDGCHVVDEKKRKKVFYKIQKIIKQESLLLALIGVIALAVSVNLVELACSLGFPAIFSEILAINKITGITRIVYLILYVLFYMIDDLVVFTIAVCTLSISTKSTKYTKYSNLIAGIIMIIIGLLLIYKPEWVMFNF